MIDDASASIDWPAGFSPAESPVHVRNDLDLSAPIEAVWARLIRASSWPEWYPNAKKVVFLPPATGPDLAPGVSIGWTTFGVGIVSRVIEFEPPFRLAWDARGVGVRAVHAWLLTPLPSGGCRVLTEETQHGWLAALAAFLMPGRMHRFHQIWLERLGE